MVKATVLIATLAAAVALTACGKKDEDRPVVVEPSTAVVATPAPSAAVTAPAGSTTTVTTPAADASASSSATVPADATSASATSK